MKTLESRFHAEVQDDLSKRQVDVIELHVGLTPNMDELQTSLIECIDATLAELRRSYTTVRSLFPRLSSI